MIDIENEDIYYTPVYHVLKHFSTTIRPGDVVLTPNPTYPIHPYSAIISGGDVRGIPVV